MESYLREHGYHPLLVTDLASAPAHLERSEVAAAVCEIRSSIAGLLYDLIDHLADAHSTIPIVVATHSGSFASEINAVSRGVSPADLASTLAALDGAPPRVGTAAIDDQRLLFKAAVWEFVNFVLYANDWNESDGAVALGVDRSMLTRFLEAGPTHRHDVH
jgi:ActR/RegA family two-component response regulator